MEEFRNIDWHPPLEDMIDDVFINEERMKTESVMYRIMQGTFTDPFTEFESDDSNEEEGNGGDEEKESDAKSEIGNKGDKGTPKAESMKQRMGYVPGIVKASFQFPRISNLNKEQHATCLRVLLRFSGSEKPEMNTTSRNELELYMVIEMLEPIYRTPSDLIIQDLIKTEQSIQKLSPTIHAEQEEFLQLAKDNWNGTRLETIGQEYIDERWRSKVEHARKLPRHYVAARNIPFNGEEKMSITEEALLLKLGKIPTVLIPVLNKRRFTIHRDADKLQLLYPASSYPSRHKTTVSEDPHCEKLAKSGNIDLIISSGGLNCLANNFGPNYTRSWILPIVVKESVNRNVVYIDKPLPPTSLTVLQKNSWIYKYFLKASLLNLHHDTSIRLTEHQKAAVAEDCLFGNPNSDDLLKLEEETDEFRSSTKKIKTEHVTLSTASISSPSQFKTDDQKVSDDQNASGVTGNSEELSSNALNENESLPKMEDSCESETMRGEDDENEKEILNAQMSATATEVSSTHSYPSSESRVVYKSFILGPSETANDDSTRTKPENYRILVRTRIDGIEKIDKQTKNLVMLAPKLEHQVALGAEAVTAEEALKQWTMLTYRPNTSLVRVRISADNSEVIQIERRTAISINNEIKRLYNLNVEDSLITLHNVIRNLKVLKPGNYLLRHTPTNGAFATIYQEADSSGKNVFDLHGIYAQNSLQTIPISPWPALDKAVITPAQICFERLPAMYHPPRTDKHIVSQVGTGRGRGRPRGISRGGGRGAAQNSGRGASTGGSRGGTRVRTKKGKKKKNKVQQKTDEIQS